MVVFHKRKLAAPLAVLGTLAAAHVLILGAFPLVWQAGAALTLAGFLPGLLLVALLVGDKPVHRPAWGERILYAAGAGYACIVVGMLLLNFLPGPISPGRILAFFNALVVMLGLWLWIRRTHSGTHTHSGTRTDTDTATLDPSVSMPAPHATSRPRPRLRPCWALPIGLLLLALVGGLLRFPNLDYAEFQGDEARAILRAVETLQGDGRAIYAHQKGPAEILLPALSYGLSGGLNEAAARLPFALASFAGLFAVYLLGARLFHPLAGLAAALLLAFDGYLIGFSRIVQYQSLVFFMGVLTLLILARLVDQPRAATRYLSLAALLLATGLLAHYEAGLVALPGLYLLWVSRCWVARAPQQTAAQAHKSTALAKFLPQPARLARMLAPPLGVGASILALFYVPFVLAPDFAATYGYIAESRIGGDFPYNNLADFFRRTTLYSPVYYIGLLTLCALVGLSHVYRRSAQGWRAWTAIGLLWIGAAVVLGLAALDPEWLGSGRDFTWLFFVAAFAPAWFSPRLTPSERAVWIWLGALMVLMLFFIRTPNTHVYGFIIPWAVMSGLILARGHGILVARLGEARAHAVGLSLALLLGAVFGVFAFSYFTASTRETLHTWRENRVPGYWVPYAMPDRARFSSFGFPMRNGWKAIGALYADNSLLCRPDQACLNLAAPFTTNDRQAVADWYTRGAYCPRDHRYYILTYPVEPGERENVALLRAGLLEDGYTQIGVVRVHGRDKSEIYDRLGETGARPHAPHAPLVIDEADAVAYFDRELSGLDLTRDGPTAAPAMDQTLGYRFGNHIWLEGYRLQRIGVDAVATGQAGLALTLYWRTDRPLETAYTVFNQVLRMEDFHKIGQQDGEPGCNAFPTNRWQPHTTIADRFFIPLDADADAGVYALLVGLYDRETGDRLPIFAPNGDFVGDALGIDEVQITR